MTTPAVRNLIPTSVKKLSLKQSVMKRNYVSSIFIRDKVLLKPAAMDISTASTEMD